MSLVATTDLLSDQNRLSFDLLGRDKMSSWPPRVFYGVESNYSDVSSQALTKCLFEGKIHLPGGDVSRALIFGDPIPGTLKQIKVVAGEKEYIFPDHLDVVLTPEGPVLPTDKLESIHSSLKFVGGSIKDEYPEQIMATLFIPEDAKVLELGSNIGRNTLVIGSLLKTGKLVTVECDPETCKVLAENIRLNGLDIPIENAALSKRKLFQQGWMTYVEGTEPAGSKPVATISFEEIETKHNLKFDTIVADCEGALYYIFTDTPEILDGIRLLIMENDYNLIEHKIKVDEIVKSKGFRRIYAKGGGWDPARTTSSKSGRSNLLPPIGARSFFKH
jgi:FkbM family methyltransferase